MAPGSTPESSSSLRREGLYSSHLTSWRKQRRAGTLKALGKKRGRQGKSEEQRELEQLRKRVAQLERDLEKSQVLIAAQKKLAEILGVDLPKLSELGIEEE
jgi:hypothetical protein